MPSDDQQSSLTAALASIRSAEQALDDVIATTADPTELSQISIVYGQLSSVATSLVQAQTASDDALFNHMVTTLKTQADALQKTEDFLSHVIKEVDKVAKIIKYIGQAAKVISSL